jgi:OPA family glycerol-3-phosphate transporter-like MFS transporter
VIEAETPPNARLRALQITTVVLLFGGYASLYFCRADLSVATPMIIEELGTKGVSHDEALVAIGKIASWGVFAYAIGKLFLTGLGDLWGGRVNFRIGLAGATLFTLCFAASGTVPLFTLAWLGNRVTQSLAWAGLVKVSSKWFDFSSHGAIIGVLSVSYLVGDAGARQSMGVLIQHGVAWRTLFYYAAGVAGLLMVANLLFLRESRKQMGFPEAHANPLNLFSESEERPRNLRALLGPLLRSRAFLLVCFLSLGCTIIRETFNDWTPIYLREYLGYSTGHAAKLSAIFPGVGAVSVVFTGWLSDKLGVNGRSIILMTGLALTAAALQLMMLIPASTSGSILPLIAIGTIAFCLLGPYSYLAGAFALDFGGQQAGAMSSGIIDGVGYLGAVMGGVTVAQFSVAFGWQGVFVGLALVSALAAAGAAALYALGRRAEAAGGHVA